MEVKKTFEEPKVEKVEFDFKTRIAASSCSGETHSIPGVYDCNVTD